MKGVTLALRFTRTDLTNVENTTSSFSLTNLLTSLLQQVTLRALNNPFPAMVSKKAVGSTGGGSSKFAIVKIVNGYLPARDGWFIMRVTYRSS
jgi:hypothetical protein